MQYTLVKRNQYSTLEVSFFIFSNLFLPFLSTDRWDYLRITNDKNQTVGTYCGYQVGKRVAVVGSSAVLIFHSDPVIQLGGFHLSFTFRQGKFKIILGKLLLLGLNLVKTCKSHFYSI